MCSRWGVVIDELAGTGRAREDKKAWPFHGLEPIVKFRLGAKRFPYALPRTVWLEGAATIVDEILRVLVFQSLLHFWRVLQPGADVSLVYHPLGFGVFVSVSTYHASVSIRPRWNDNVEHDAQGPEDPA